MISGTQELLWQNVSYWQNVLENLVFDFFKNIKVIILQEKYSLIT